MKYFDACPAYGRRYPKLQDLLLDYHAGKDFQSTMGGFRYFSKRDEASLKADGYIAIRFYRGGMLFHVHQL